MILAAGRGQRMNELTQHTAKPLLKIRKRCLIEYAIDSLVRANIREIVINISWCAEKIKQYVGNGNQFGADIVYSYEPLPLETAGGIVQALPLLGSDQFVVVSADVVTDYPLEQLKKALRLEAHLILVKNPSFKLLGDFSLKKNQHIFIAEKNPFTFASFGIYHPDFFAGCLPGKLFLIDVFRKKIIEQQMTGELYTGRWFNVGTPEQLAECELYF